MASDSPSLLNKDSQHSDIWMHGGSLPWSGCEALPLRLLSGMGLLPGCEKRGRLAVSSCWLPQSLLSHREPPPARSCPSWYSGHLGEVGVHRPDTTEGQCSLLMAFLDFHVHNPVFSYCLPRCWFPKSHLATPNSTLASFWWCERAGLPLWQWTWWRGAHWGNGEVYHIKCMLLRKAWLTEVQGTPKHLNHLFLLIKVNTLRMVLINTLINFAHVMVLLCL